jgi:hypothetical protein
MTTTSGASALALTRSAHAMDAPRPWRPARRRLLSVVGQLNAFVWGDARPSVPASDDRRPAEIERITGPVATDAHTVPLPPVPVDKRSAVAHYRAMAEQVAHEQRVTGVSPPHGWGAAPDA